MAVSLTKGETMLTWIVVAILLLGGVAVIFARDQIWKLTVLSNQMSGRASERSQVWDISMIIVGIGAIILAIIIIASM